MDYSILATWKHEVHLSRSCSDLDAADNRLATRLAECLAQYPQYALAIESELYIMGANDLWPIVKIRAAKIKRSWEHEDSGNRGEAHQQSDTLASKRKRRH